MTDDARSILTLDSHAVQVLAHPLRSRLLTALRVHGPATATALAETLDTNTGATSYHLRRLASVGLVEETEEGRGRERWWRAASETHGWTERAVAGDADGEAASDWLRRYYLRSFIERYESWLDASAEWPLAWRDVAGASDVVMRLTPDRLAAFQAEFEALCARFRENETPADDPAGQVDPALPVRVPVRGRAVMTALDARTARRRFLVLTGLRWLPTGLLIPVTVLLALSRGLSLTEIGLVFSLQGLVVLAPRAADRRSVQFARPPAGADPRQPRRARLARPSHRGRLGRAVRGLDGPPGRLPGAGQRSARGVVRRRDPGRRAGCRDREGPGCGERRPQRRDRHRRADVRAPSSRWIRSRRSRAWSCR